MLPNIEIDNKILEACPNMQIGLIRANVVNGPTHDDLWEIITSEEQEILNTYLLSDINKRPAIVGTRSLYKHLGKDPNRYRVASEALCRRVVRKLGLYRINALVDLINLVSMKSGYPISGLDADKIAGNTLTMGIGQHDETFHGIRRGLLNIEGLPVYRDEIGGIASPTSDEERTKITCDTTNVQININAFAPEMPLAQTMEWCIDLMKRFANASMIEQDIFTPINK